MEVNRGDLVTAVLPGDYGKPRPALVIQANAFQALPSVTLLWLTTDLNDWPLFRITLQPNQTNGLRTTSQVAVDKTSTVPRSRIGQRIGAVDTPTMRAVQRALTRFLGLA